MNVNKLANQLGISEGDVFEDAYESFYGTGQLDHSRVDTDFGQYMKDGTCPPYVNHYLRNHFLES